MSSCERYPRATMKEYRNCLRDAGISKNVGAGIRHESLPTVLTTFRSPGAEHGEGTNLHADRAHGFINAV